MALLRQSYTTPLPPDAEVFTRKGERFVRVTIGGKIQTFPLSKNGMSYVRESPKWYGQFVDGDGIVQRKPLSTDKQAARKMLDRLERAAERERNGVADPIIGHARRELADHLAGYESHLNAKGDDERHVRQTVAMIQTVFESCKFVFVRDLDAEAVTRWLNDRRATTEAREIPPGDSFTPAEAARYLGLSADGLRKAVVRHRLAGTGQGKARRFSRAVVETIAQAGTKGLSPRTANSYTTALRSFSRWLLRGGRIANDPFASLPLLDGADDIRHGRRELTAEELARLFDATRRSKRTALGLDGEDRYFLYLATTATGFRANAMAHFTPSDFRLDGDSPVVVLPVKLNKSKKVKIQPVPATVAGQLREYLATRPAGKAVWSRTKAKSHRWALMLRLDLEEAGIPYIVEGPSGPEYADFHALRHTYLTLLGRSGVDLGTAQVLAGHSTPVLTARYTHKRLNELADAVGKLPELAREKKGEGGEFLTLPLTLNPRTPLHSIASICTFDFEADKGHPLENCHENQAKSLQFNSVGGSEAGGDRTHDPQIKSPGVSPQSILKFKGKTSTDDSPYTAPYTACPELDELISLWPTLPLPVRKAIAAIAEARPAAPERKAA